MLIIMSQKTYCPNCGALYFPEDQFCSKCGALVNSTSSTEEITQSKPKTLDSTRIQEYKSYIQIIGIVEIVFGVLGLVVGGFAIILAGFFSSIIEGDEVDTPNESEVADFVTAMIFLAAILIILFGIVAIISGKKLMEYQKSGRIGTMLIGALSLLNIPIGTIFGVFVLYILTRPEVEELFS